MSLSLKDKLPTKKRKKKRKNKEKDKKNKKQNKTNKHSFTFHEVANQISSFQLH